MADITSTKPNTSWTSEGGSSSTSFSTVTSGVTTSWSTSTTGVNTTHGVNTTAPDSTWANFAVLNWGDAKMWGALDYLWGAQ